MKEVSKARVICGIMAIALLFVEIFIYAPDAFDAWNYGFDITRTILPVILRICFYGSIGLWSLSGVIKLDESDN